MSRIGRLPIHLDKSVKASIEARGLVIRVLTDDLLFASGQATLEAKAGGAHFRVRLPLRQPSQVRAKAHAA